MVTWIKETSIEKLKTSIIYPIFEGEMIEEKIIQKLEYNINDQINRKLGKITTTFTLGKYPFQKLLFIGCGKKEEINQEKIKECMKEIIKEMKEDMIWNMNSMKNEFMSTKEMAYTITEEYEMQQYQFKKIGNEKKELKPILTIMGENIQEEINQAVIDTISINQARMLVDMPSNLLKQKELANYAEEKVKKWGLEYKILGKEQLEKIGAGGILAVNQGSIEEAKLVYIRYNGGGKEDPWTALIGKGIIYDSGGYNLKTPANLLSEKIDMAGAISMLQVLEILVKKQEKCNVMVLMPIAENVIDATAYKCDDVIQTLSGKTVEITNTDAEGRLLLCDAISYAIKEGADKIIDMATLTGGCIKALGSVYSGGFSNQDNFYHEFETTCKQSGEKIWRLPLDKEYQKQIKDTYVADLINSTGNSGEVKAGASIAAAFLNEFVPDEIPWIHIDIAGTASNQKGATGVMIKSIANFLTIA